MRSQVEIIRASTLFNMAERQDEPIKAGPEEAGSITGEYDGNTSDIQLLVSNI